MHIRSMFLCMCICVRLSHFANRLCMRRTIVGTVLLDWIDWSKNDIIIIFFVITITCLARLNNGGESDQTVSTHSGHECNSNPRNSSAHTHTLNIRDEWVYLLVFLFACVCSRYKSIRNMFIVYVESKRARCMRIAVIWIKRFGKGTTYNASKLQLVHTKRDKDRQRVEDTHAQYASKETHYFTSLL